MQIPEIPDGLEISVASPVTVTGTGIRVITTNLRQNFSDDIMSYVYPKYSNHPDVAAHVKQFRSIWAVNHGMHELTPTEREQSMIVEFQLYLEGQAARWYAQQDISTFTTFQELVGKF
jgi:hypothetical protein